MISSLSFLSLIHITFGPRTGSRGGGALRWRRSQVRTAHARGSVHLSADRVTSLGNRWATDAPLDSFCQPWRIKFDHLNWAGDVFFRSPRYLCVDCWRAVNSSPWQRGFNGGLFLDVVFPLGLHCGNSRMSVCSALFLGWESNQFDRRPDCRSVRLK